MEVLYDTEMQESIPANDVQDGINKSQYQSTDNAEIEEVVTEKDTDNIEYILEQFISLYGDNSNENAQVTTETTAVLENDNKPFEKSGFEVAVVLCLAILIGLNVLDMLTKRWFT